MMYTYTHYNITYLFTLQSYIHYLPLHLIPKNAGGVFFSSFEAMVLDVATTRKYFNDNAPWWRDLCWGTALWFAHQGQSGGSWHGFQQLLQIYCSEPKWPKICQNELLDVARINSPSQLQTSFPRCPSTLTSRPPCLDSTWCRPRPFAWHWLKQVGSTHKTLPKKNTDGIRNEDQYSHPKFFCLNHPKSISTNWKSRTLQLQQVQELSGSWAQRYGSNWCHWWMTSARSPETTAASWTSMWRGEFFHREPLLVKLWNWVFDFWREIWSISTRNTASCI